MRKIDDIQTVYFLGIGGIGMSALARYFMLMGKDVYGYDRTSTPLTKALEEEGMKIHYKDKPSEIPEDTDIVIFTPAIPDDLKEKQFILNSGFPTYKRSEVLGMIAENHRCIAVAGTHGKTSTTSIVTHILKESGKAVSAFIGGISKNLDSNFYFTPDSKYVVVEADEFDRSFLTLYPDFAIITSTDADHLDIYGNHEILLESFSKFCRQVKPRGTILLHANVKLETGGHRSCNYDIGEGHNHYAYNIRNHGDHSEFDLVIANNLIKDVVFGIAGLHNIENAIAASTAAYWAGCSLEDIKKALETYQGVKRRFDFRIKKKELIYIDDYAHHPKELSSCINAVKSIYPDKEITGIFQPHLFTRTRDFGDDFARSLEALDKIILMDIYPAREEPIEGITSKWLLDKINKTDKVLLGRDEIVDHLKNNKPEVLLTLGAGDIDRLVKPIEKALG